MESQSRSDSITQIYSSHLAITQLLGHAAPERSFAYMSTPHNQAESLEDSADHVFDGYLLLYQLLVERQGCRLS